MLRTALGCFVSALLAATAATPALANVQIPGLVSNCGSDYYRVRSTSAPVLSRKFALVMSAFLADRRLTFQHDDVGSCEGDRKLVGWIRLVP